MGGVKPAHLLMKERKQTIQIGKKEYKLFFSMQAFNEVTDRYGGFKEMTEKIGVESTTDYAWLIALMINQNIEIENAENGTKEPYITEKMIMLHLTPAGFITAKNVMFEAINAGMSREIKSDTENEEDEVLGEIKNAESAVEK